MKNNFGWEVYMVRMNSRQAISVFETVSMDLQHTPRTLAQIIAYLNKSARMTSDDIILILLNRNRIIEEFFQAAHLQFSTLEEKNCFENSALFLAKLSLLQYGSSLAESADKNPIKSYKEQLRKMLNEELAIINQNDLTSFLRTPNFFFQQAHSTSAGVL